MKRIIVGFVVVLVLVVVVVALLPGIVGPGIVRGTIEEKVNGTVVLGDTKLGWFGEQRVSGLVIKDAAGQEAVALNVRIKPGLLAIGLGTAASIDIVVDGTVSGAIRSDRSMTFAELVKSEEKPKEKTPKSPAPAAEPISAAGVTPMTVRVDGIDVRIADEQSGQTLQLKGLTGDLAFAPGADATIDLEATTSADGLDGALRIDGIVSKLFDKSGALTVKGATADLTVEASSLPILYSPRKGELKRLVVGVKSTDLTKAITIDFEADASIENFEPSSLRGSIVANGLINERGTIVAALDRITGSISGQRVPTALLQPFLAGTAIDLPRDVGETADLNADFSAGDAHRVTLDLKSDQMTVEIAANVDARDGSTRGERLHVEMTALPALVKELAKLNIDKPAQIVVEVQSFSLPAPAADGSVDLGAVAAKGSIRIPTPLTVSDDRKTLANVTDIVINFDSPGLSESMTLTGGAGIDGGAFTFDERLTGLIQPDGTLSAMEARSDGTLKASDVPGALLARFITTDSPIVQAVLQDVLNLTLTTSADGGTVNATVVGSIGPHKADLALSRLEGALRVESGSLEMTLSPELFALMQSDRPEPIVLQAPARATVRIGRFEVPEPQPLEFDLSSATVPATITLEDAVLSNVPSVTQPLGIRSFNAKITAQLADDPTYTARGKVLLRRVEPDANLGKLDFDVTAKTRGETTESSGTASLQSISVRNLEHVLGKKRGSLSQWLGDSGTISAELGGDASEQKATIGFDMPQLAGTFVAALRDDMVNVTADSSRITLQREALETMLNPAPGEGAEKSPEADAMRVVIAEDVPMSFAIKTMRVPKAMLSGEPFDPSQVDIDMSLGGGPLVLGNAQGSHSSLDDLNVSVRSRNLAQGIDFTVDGKAKDRRSGDAGAINVVGVVTGVMTEGSTFDSSDASIEMTATTTRVPTAVADAFLNMQGLLVAAVGPQMNSKFVAKSFSANSGTLDADITTDNGSLKGRIRGVKGDLRTFKNKPIVGELEVTPPLRDRLLEKIHPVLADVRTTEQPIRATVGNLILPGDSKTKRLKADIDITVGAVEFDSGSSMLKILNFVQAANADTFPGYVEPIRAAIRRGVVKYEQFSVRVGPYTMAYEGTVDLNTREVNLRTQLPLGALTKTILTPIGTDLGGQEEGIIVPVVTTGKLGNLKTEIDPDFVGDLLKGRLEKEIGDKIGGGKDGNPLGGILDKVKEGLGDKP